MSADLIFGAAGGAVLGSLVGSLVCAVGLIPELLNTRRRLHWAQEEIDAQIQVIGRLQQRLGATACCVVSTSEAG